MTERHAHNGNPSGFPTVGRWRVTALPAGWMFVAGFGIKHMVTDPQAVVANVSLGEDALTAPNGLRSYIAAQSGLMQHHLVDARMAGPQPMPFPGAEEAYLMFVRHTMHPPDGEPQTLPQTMLHAQRYVRSGVWVGIVTLTVPESQLQSVRTDYEAFVKGLRIMPLESATVH